MVLRRRWLSAGEKDAHRCLWQGPAPPAAKCANSLSSGVASLQGNLPVHMTNTVAPTAHPSYARKSTCRRSPFRSTYAL